VPPRRLSAAASDERLAQLPGFEDREGISVFARDEQGRVFHTYSTYARGIDMMNGAYQFLDLVPKGRDEPADGDPQFWVRRRDEYGS
jgi:predicted dithiol-disulfide oxidoreductase (DUF899 family)